MSSKFTDAMNYVCGYYWYKLRSETNAVRPMWFTGFAKYAEKPEDGVPDAPEKLVDMLDLFDPAEADAKAFELYSKAKEGGSEVSSRENHAARVRLRVMASLRQTVGRQLFGSDSNARTRADSHRYEHDRKVAALGLATTLRDNFKETE